MNGTCEFPAEDISECRETHLSRVFLTPRYVYKVKKPVNLEFADFSTFIKRWRAVCCEVALNRRLTSQVYRGITCLFPGGAGYRLGRKSCIRPLEELPPTNEEGAEVAVVMRRLNEEWTLQALLRGGKVTAASHIRPLARRLAEFHQVHALPYLDPKEYCKSVYSSIAENFTAFVSRKPTLELSSLAQHILKAAKSYADEHWPAVCDLLSARLSKRRVVDGHGDLRCEHVYFEPKNGSFEIQIIDCLEFNRELRQIDVASDLAFLAMDLDREGHENLSAALCAEYSAFSGDEDILRIIPYFKCYRAMVRAKVHLLRASQLEDDSAARKEISQLENYLALVHRYVLGVQKPALIVFCGLMGTGKSTLAGALAKLTAAKVYSSDIMRREIFGNTGAKDSERGYGDGIYGPEQKCIVYRLMCQRAGESLARGTPVILDASFTKREYREMAYKVAQKLRTSCLLVECKLDHDLAKMRIAERIKNGATSSDARPEHLTEHAGEWETVLSAESASYLSVSCDLQAEDNALRLAHYVASLTAKDCAGVFHKTLMIASPALKM